MTKNQDIIRIKDKEAKRMLNILVAREDKVTQGDITARLIRKEYATVFSQPNDMATVEEAVAGMKQ